MSRCTVPCLCAYSRALATCTPICATLRQYVGFLAFGKRASPLCPGRTTEEDANEEESAGRGGIHCRVRRDGIGELIHRLLAGHVGTGVGAVVLGLLEFACHQGAGQEGRGEI